MNLWIGGQPPEQVKGEVVGVEVAHKGHHRLGGVQFGQLPLNPVKDEGVLRQLDAEAGVVKIGDLHENLLTCGSGCEREKAQATAQGACRRYVCKKRFEWAILSTISRENVENSSPLLQKAQPGPQRQEHQAGAQPA